MKIESTKAEFHHQESLSISWSTVASSNKIETRERFIPDWAPGSQESLKIFTEEPSPIYQRAPSKITLRALRILLQANDPKPTLA